jgi:hypothetical protein
MPEQPLFRAWRQETVSATQRLLEAGASACVGGAMLNFAHAIASTYSQAKPPIP